MKCENLQPLVQKSQPSLKSPNLFPYVFKSLLGRPTLFIGRWRGLLNSRPAIAPAATTPPPSLGRGGGRRKEERRRESGGACFQNLKIPMLGKCWEMWGNPHKCGEMWGNGWPPKVGENDMYDRWDSIKRRVCGGYLGKVRK